MPGAAIHESAHLKAFTDLGLAEALLKALTAEGYSEPTPIQSSVIPAMIASRDILGIAQTGTGKTAAFVLPLLQRIAASRQAVPAKRCGALILAPTRELAAQIADSVTAYGRFLKITSTVIVGGVKPGPQIRAVADGIDIVIATPGRLLDHVSSGVLQLDRVQTIVLDEADQMLDLGFAPAIRKVMAALPRERQTVLLSATMPGAIRSLARDFLKDPKECSVAPVSRPIERIDQRVVHLKKDAKRARLVELLKSGGVERAIVFTRTKRGADKVCQHLAKAGLSSSAIHGNKSQGQRERALAAFRKGGSPILVATDIAARGIDIDDVSHVINYELPNVPEAYVHRIGRTARAGKSGIAISLCEPAERDLLRDIEKLTGVPLRSAGKGTDTVPSAEPAVRKTGRDRSTARPMRPASAKTVPKPSDGKGTGYKRPMVAFASAAHGGAVMLFEK